MYLSLRAAAENNDDRVIADFVISRGGMKFVLFFITYKCRNLSKNIYFKVFNSKNKPKMAD